MTGLIQIILLAGVPLAWVQALGYGLSQRSVEQGAASRWLALLFVCIGCWHLEGSFVSPRWILTLMRFCISES